MAQPWTSLGLRPRCYQTRCVYPTHSKPNAKAEKEFIHEAAKQEDERRNFKLASWKARGSGYLWDKESGWSEAWGAWGKVYWR